MRRLLFPFALILPLLAQQPASIDAAVDRVLKATGVPSASVAVVKEGKLFYAHAYGQAKLAPNVPAAPAMRYSIGSVSKQFTASALLLLAEENKLSLDDKVAKYLPDLARAGEISLRQLLSHTSGYRDYWPEDYVPQRMLQPITPAQLLADWATKQLDFDPGTRWQYSNTNYVAAGRIVEQVSGQPFFQFLEERIFTPLKMRSAFDIDRQALPVTDANGYRRFALGPPRPAPKEAPGWLFAAGQLAMTGSDLARWDISLIERNLLKPASYDALTHEVMLANGEGTHYGLGVNVSKINGRRTVSHGGEVSGFVTQNIVFPDDRAAIVVLTNQDASSAAGAIAREIRSLLFPDGKEEQTKLATAQAKSIFSHLQQGQLDRPLFTPEGAAYFTPEALADIAASIGRVGPPTEFVQASTNERGGMTFRSFRIRCGTRNLRLTTYARPDGKLAQFLIEPVTE